jgi:sulfur carrier protein ThiS
MSKKDPMRYLNKNKWYHGTTLEGWKGICGNGILADYNKGNELDFGHGFYLTPIKEQAEKFITTIIRITQENKAMQSEMAALLDMQNSTDQETAVIVEFDFVPIDWLAREKDLKFKLLSSYNDEFAEFVFFNRVDNSDGLYQHEFDLIFGVMSDSNPIFDIIKYKNGEIGKADVIESFKKNTSAKQLSIHSQALCDMIIPSRAYIIETGEELNAHDYIDKRKRSVANEPTG